MSKQAYGYYLRIGSDKGHSETLRGFFPEGIDLEIARKQCEQLIPANWFRWNCKVYTNHFCTTYVGLE
jgi:hypothetical protein